MLTLMAMASRGELRSQTFFFSFIRSDVDHLVCLQGQHRNMLVYLSEFGDKLVYDLVDFIHRKAPIWRPIAQL